METSGDTNFHSRERERIQAEYRRREKIIPPSRYESQGDKYLYQDRKQHVVDLLQKNKLFPLTEKKILEVGCGLGVWLRDFLAWGAQEQNLSGVELDSKKVETLKERMPRSDIKEGDAAELPWASESFDLVIQSTLFTSILNFEYKKKVACEMMRVLKPSGVILWYDFRYNNPFNLNVRGIEQPEIQKLYPEFKLHVKKMTIVPPLARFLAPRLPGLMTALSRISILNTHYLVLMRKR